MQSKHPFLLPRFAAFRVQAANGTDMATYANRTTTWFRITKATQGTSNSGYYLTGVSLTGVKVGGSMAAGWG